MARSASPASVLFGVGGYQLAEAGMVLLLAHAALKAAQLMVAGIVDHGAGTDIRSLHGFAATGASCRSSP
jgi:multicomponent Na+:H+ antiporter subunit A